MLDDLGRFDKIFGLVLNQGDRVPELREAVRAAVQPRDAATATATATQEQALHVVAMAALGGYHLFSIMHGQAFHGVAEDDFIQLLADLTAPSHEGMRSSSRKGVSTAPERVSTRPTPSCAGGGLMWG
jgi:hypothetical protein